MATFAKITDRLLSSGIGDAHSDRPGWPRCATVSPIRAEASTIIIFSLMANREDGYL